MDKLLSFQEVLTKVKNNKQGKKIKPHLLLGNGFSRACRNDIFAYDALFNQADFSSFSPNIKTAFEKLTTTDFEVVMQALCRASILVSVYNPENTSLINTFEKDCDGLRELLAKTIADNHPSRPSDIPIEKYIACKFFLSHFNRIYTLNYDLLLYWTLMQDEIKPLVKADDGFRDPPYLKSDYVTWEVTNSDSQNIYYLHGALHLFDDGAELKKFTWNNTKIALIDQIRKALKQNMYPLIVAEGASPDKLNKINHSNYLSRCYRSFSGIGGALFIYGHSMAENDEHLIKLIGQGKVTQLFISIYGDPSSQQNKYIINRAYALHSQRKEDETLELYFYDASTAKVWG